ncbi:MAG: antibiotic biosynthesis monooxygenase, partial [Loktanella sp.]|nr:antibiotic biosynthesis monooxygenase [Loktanella sp.]
MHALFFEMRPLPGHLDHYFAHATRLRPILAQHAGLHFLDRYLSLDEPDLLLSHQLWASEAAIIGWRKDNDHRLSQEAGRKVHFADYRIRVGARLQYWPTGAASYTPDT